MIDHIYPQQKGDGLYAYGKRIDSLMRADQNNLPDIKHFELGYVSSDILWQAWRLKKRTQPYILTLHDPPIVAGKPFSPWLNGNVLNRLMRKVLDLTIGRKIIYGVVRGARTVIVLNKAAIPGVENKFGISNVKYLPHPIIFEQKYANSSASKLSILYFGHISPHKGIDLLLKSIDDVKWVDNNFTLTIAGRADAYKNYETSLINQANKSTYPSHIKFTGYIDDGELNHLVTEADIIVLPYRPDPILHASGPLIWSMSFGKAVLASDVPVLNSEIKNEINGLLFQPDDYLDLSKKLSRLVSDPKLRQSLGVAAKEHILEEHSDQLITSRLKEIYLAK